jgi:hypothetical protein
MRAGFFQKLCKAEEDLIQRSAGLTGAHHVHINLRKLSWIALKHGAIGCPSTNLFADIGHEAFHGLLLGLIDHDSEGLD